MIDFERIVQEVYEAVLRPGDTTLDVGAHVGRHTVPMARCVGPAGSVLAVEPLPACREELGRRIRCEDAHPLAAIQILSCALSDHAGSALLVVAEDSLPHSGLRAVPYPIPTRTSTLPVEVETIDRLFLSRASLHFIKLDAEGAELHILLGGIGCIEKFRPVVAFEFGTYSNQAFEVQPADMARFWAERGYAIYAITGQRLEETQFDQVARVREIWDYVAVPREKVALDRLVQRVLNRPRVNWLAVRAELNHAHDHAEVGAVLPPLRSFRGPLWPMARAAARLFLLAARVITVTQRLFNRALLLALEQLADDLEKAERETQRQDRHIEDLQRRLDVLESNFERLREENEEMWERAAEHRRESENASLVAKG